MSSGLQVFSAAGATLLDTTDKLLRYVGTYAISAASGVNSGTVSVPGMADDGTWFVYTGVDDPTWGATPIYAIIGAGSFTWYRYSVTGAFSTQIAVMRS